MHVCVSMYICVYIVICVSVHMCAYMCTCVCVIVCACARTHLHRYVYPSCFNIPARKQVHLCSKERNSVQKVNRARHKEDGSALAVKTKAVYNEEFVVHFYLPKIKIPVVVPHDYSSEFPGDRIVWYTLHLNRLFTRESGLML